MTGPFHKKYDRLVILTMPSTKIGVHKQTIHWTVGRHQSIGYTFNTNAAELFGDAFVLSLSLIGMPIRIRETKKRGLLRWFTKREDLEVEIDTDHQAPLYIVLAGYDRWSITITDWNAFDEALETRHWDFPHKVDFE